MKNLFLASILVMVAATGASAATLILNQSALTGHAGDTVGWGFTIANSPHWIVITNADLLPDSGVFPVGVFTAFITNTFTVIGPDMGNGEVTPWIQAFDPTLQTGIGSYRINSFQSPGDKVTGNIRLYYDEFSVSPLDPVFDPIADTLQTGLSMSATASVAVVSAPESPSAVLVALCLIPMGLGWRRRSRHAGKALGVLAAILVLHGAAHASITQTAKLPLRAAYSVASDGSTMVVGTPTPGQGSASIFVRSGNTWSLEATLPPPADAILGQPLFYGLAVALSGDTVAIGAENDHLGVGAVWIFTRSQGIWTEQAKIVSPGTQGFFGRAVALDGDTLLVGSYGTASTYTRSGSRWSLQQTISDPTGGNGPNFGTALALKGDVAVVSTTSRGQALVLILSGGRWHLGPSLTAADGAAGFGVSVAIGNGMVVVGAPTNTGGAAYVFTSSDPKGPWTQAAKLAEPNNVGSSMFGASVAISGDSVLVGESGNTGTSTVLAGFAYVFLRSGSVWNPAPVLAPSDGHVGDEFGNGVAFAGDLAIVTARGVNAGIYVFALQNVTLLSSPAGRGFSVSGCGTTGAFVTPFSGFFSNCIVTWNTPDTATPHTRYTFQNWSDGGTANPRTFSLPLDAAATNYSYTGNFLTEYELTTQASPISGGTVTGAGWYKDGWSVGVGAVANPGFTFAGFTSGLSGFVSPQAIVMTSPQTVTGAFAATPPAVLSAVVTGKSGATTNRAWTISLTNGGPGTAYNAQFFVLQFTQTFGAACTALPVRLSPAALPVSLGTLASGTAAQASTTLDFSGCPANARFTVGVGYMSNGGASGGVIQLANQMQ